MARAFFPLLLIGLLTPVAAQPPSHPVAALARAMAEAEQSLKENEVQIAESRYRQALLEGWLLLGALKVAGDDLDAAQRAFEKASTAAVETRRADNWRALVHLQLDQTAEALALLTRLVSRHPDDVDARRLLAQTLVAAGRHEEAVQELEEALAVAPDDVEIGYTLANGYLRLGKVERAEPLFERLASERPIPQTYILIGRSYGSARLFERARAAFEAALEIDPEVPRGHYYLGTIELLAAGRDGLEAAIEHFERAIRLEPDDPMVNLYLGTARLATRRFEAAIPALETAARHQRTRVDALRFLGGCHLGLDRPAEAAAVLQQALAAAEAGGAKDRQLASVHYQLGLALRRQGAADEAAGHFAAAERYSEKLVEGERDSLTRFLSDGLEQTAPPDTVKPPLDVAWLDGLSEQQRADLESKVGTDLARAYLNLGILQLRAQRPRRAAEILEQAAAVDPEFPQLQASLGTAYFNAGRFDRATAPLARALESDPVSAGLRRMTALAWLNAGDHAQAADLLRDDPERQTNPSLQVAYGLALLRSGRAQEAQTLFEELLARNARWPELHVALGQVQAQLGDYETAVASLERALELDPGVAGAHATLGEMSLRQGRLEEAEKALRSEVEQHPEDLETRYLLATALDLNRRSEAAEAELESVLAERPDHADAHYLLGKILLARGAAEEAAAHLEAAAELSPEDENVYYQLGQAYQRLGRTEQAKRQFEIYRELKPKTRDDGA